MFFRLPSQLSSSLYHLPTYISRPDTVPIQVTTAGNASLFHGVPDWVYEEEIFSADFALWWSPDSSKVAFLVFDETAVDEFSFPIYNPTNDASTINPYTTEMIMKYPKPGFNNPLVSVHVFDLAMYQAHNGGSANIGIPLSDETLTLDWDGRHPVEDSVIMEVAWVGVSSLMLKEVNRNADDGSVVFFNLNADDIQSRALGKVVRKLGKHGEEGDDGWIDEVRDFLSSEYALAHPSLYLGPFHLSVAFGSDSSRWYRRLLRYRP